MKILRPLPVLAAIALVASAAAQPLLAARRAAAAPALAESAFVAFGALRSVLAEVVWFRADRLQAEGRYVELAQLASTLALLEPHTPEVWSFAAWNLAYNVSVMMNEPEDRWRWVEASIRLLRDEGLKATASSPGRSSSRSAPTSTPPRRTTARSGPRRCGTSVAAAPGRNSGWSPCG